MTDEQPLIQRRQILTSLSSLVLLSGCLGGPVESSTETTTTTGTNISEPESTESGWAATTTSDCGRTKFCKGSELVRVRIDGGFSGKIVLSPVYCGSDIGLSPGKTEMLVRQTDAETCNVKLLVDGEVIYGGRIQDYECVTVRVDSDGEIPLRKEVLQRSQSPPVISSRFGY